MGRHLDRITRDWQELGRADPLWAVYVAPRTSGGRWDVERFLETGRREVERVLEATDRSGRPTGTGCALDFGCGVGRLTGPLADRFERVIGVDVSSDMLDRARELLGDRPDIELVCSKRDDLAFVATGSVDLVYSSLVLQHLPRRLAARYLAEFVRVLAPGGVAVVQVATRPTLSGRGLLSAVLPQPVIGVLQTRVLGYPAPMRMEAMPRRWMRARTAELGAALIDETEDRSYGGHWVYTRYVIGR